MYNGCEFFFYTTNTLFIKFINSQSDNRFHAKMLIKTFLKITSTAIKCYCDITDLMFVHLHAIICNL